MKNRLRSTWNQGKGGVNGWVSIPSPFVAELTARQDFDSVVVDDQNQRSGRFAVFWFHEADRIVAFLRIDNLDGERHRELRSFAFGTLHREITAHHARELAADGQS